jgi:putative zinc finger/helix-turn-helix YgiT family protein
MKCPTCNKEMKSKIRDYEYVESGLKGVVLKGIRVYECKACGEVLPEIRNVKQVHKWIAEYLIKKQSPLTGEEFRFLRKSMGKSATDLTKTLGVYPVTISRWENNKAAIGPQSDRLLRALFVLQNSTLLQNSFPTIDSVFAHMKAHKPKPERIVIPSASLTAQP